MRTSMFFSILTFILFISMIIAIAANDMEPPDELWLPGAFLISYIIACVAISDHLWGRPIMGLFLGLLFLFVYFIVVFILLLIFGKREKRGKVPNQEMTPEMKEALLQEKRHDLRSEGKIGPFIPKKREYKGDDPSKWAE